MNDRFDQLEKAIAENDEEAAKAKAVGDTVEYAASVKEEVKKREQGKCRSLRSTTCALVWMGPAMHGIWATGARCY